MKPTVFISFSTSDAGRAEVVFRRAALFCRVKTACPSQVGRHLALTTGTLGDGSLVSAMAGTTLSLFLVGTRFPDEAFEQERRLSVMRGNRALAIDISCIKTLKAESRQRPPHVPAAWPFYRWLTDDGYDNLGRWMEPVAVVADQDGARIQHNPSDLVRRERSTH